MLLRVSEIKIKYAQENPVETNSYHSVLGGFPAHLPLTLGLYTLTSVCIFSILFSIHFSRC